MRKAYKILKSKRREQRYKNGNHKKIEVKRAVVLCFYKLRILNIGNI